MKEYTVYRLVKSEDLNHHGTLFAGRTAEWFVESSFVAAACAVGNPEHIVCVNIHGMEFKSSVKKGDIICFTSKIAYVGKTSIVVYTRIHSETSDLYPVEGFITFVSVELDGKKRPHGLLLDEPANEKEIIIREKAKKLLVKN
jgi:acyl-CoA hydrolase